MEPSEDISAVAKPHAEWLGGELAAWVREGLLTPQQADRIRERYGAPPPTRDNSRLITIISVLGVLLLGAGVILFFAANWQAIPKWGKLALIFGIILSAHGGGYYLQFYRASYPGIGAALILFGCVCYGAAIWLIAQIFNINAHYPNGVLFWALGVLPVAWAVSSAMVLSLATILFTLWTILETFGFSYCSPFYVALLILLVAPLCYRLRSPWALALTLTGLSYWLGSYVYSTGGQHGGSVVLIYPTLGLILYVAGLAHRGREKVMSLAPAYIIVGLIATLLSLYALTFEGLVNELMREHSRGGLMTGAHGEMWILYGLAIVMLALCALAPRRLAMSSDESTKFQLAVLGGILALSIFAWVFPAFGAKGTILWLVMNIGFFALAIALIYGGYQARNILAVNLGMLFFVVGAITRYFDCLWGMMHQSVFFITGGVLLLLMGTFLERRRRAIVREIAGGKP